MSDFDNVCCFDSSQKNTEVNQLRSASSEGSNAVALNGEKATPAGLFVVELSPVWQFILKVSLSDFHHVIFCSPAGSCCCMSCTIAWHKLHLSSEEFRLQRTCAVYVSVYLISVSDPGHSDTGEFWSSDLTRRDVALKVEWEIILFFFHLPRSQLRLGNVAESFRRDYR